MSRAAPALLGALAAALVAAGPAAALSPPEVFLKELNPSEMPTGEWVPVSGAHMHSVTGYELGLKVQNSGQPGNRQRILFKTTSVPDGHPDQRNIYSLCVFVSGAEGAIVAPDERIRYEGDGSYSISATVSTGTDESTGCEPGATSTGTFTVDAPTTITLREPLVTVDPRESHPFSGALVTPPPGAGGTEVLCARDPKPASDGSLTGSKVKTQMGTGVNFAPVKFDADSLFPTVGRWACVARGEGGGVIPGPWSAPTATRSVRTGFYGPADGGTRIVDWRGPTYVIVQRLSPLTAGGRLTMLLRDTTRRRNVARLRIRVGKGGVARARFHLPRLRASDPGHGYLYRFAFAGNRFVAARKAFLVGGFGSQRVGRRTDIFFGAPCLPRRC